MKHKIFIPGILILSFAAVCILYTTGFASNTEPSSVIVDVIESDLDSDKAATEEIIPNKPAMFSNHKRPVPAFDHTIHEDSLGEEGCAKCHHVLDAELDELVYEEGEEVGCIECHTPEDETTAFDMKDASHASCTACHREMKKEKLTAGPTTCGECHKN
jgi:hypothetical protein